MWLVACLSWLPSRVASTALFCCAVVVFVCVCVCVCLGLKANVACCVFSWLLSRVASVALFCCAVVVSTYIRTHIDDDDDDDAWSVAMLDQFFWALLTLSHFAFCAAAFGRCWLRLVGLVFRIAAAAAITYDEEEEEMKRDDWHDTRGEFCRRGGSSV